MLLLRALLCLGVWRLCVRLCCGLPARLSEHARVASCIRNCVARLLQRPRLQLHACDRKEQALHLH